MDPLDFIPYFLSHDILSFFKLDKFLDTIDTYARITWIQVRMEHNL